MWATVKKYLFTVDGIVAFVAISIALYFILTTKRKRYKIDVSPDAFVFDPKDPFLLRKRKRSKRSKTSKTSKRSSKTSSPKVNKHEERCREIFQQIFGVKFKSVRPKWLKNPVTKKNLELDGFNPDIVTPKGRGLAFEYDGQQHSKFVPHFHRGGPDEFEYQVVKDSWKDKRCEQEGVLLIRIPHFVAFQDLDRYIKMILRRKNMTLPSQGGGMYA